MLPERSWITMSMWQFPDQIPLCLNQLRDLEMFNPSAVILVCQRMILLLTKLYHMNVLGQLKSVS